MANRRAVFYGRIYKLNTYIYSITSIASTYKDSVVLSFKRNYAVFTIYTKQYTWMSMWSSVDFFHLCNVTSADAP